MKDYKDYPDQVDPADEDHIYFNADPGEKPVSSIYKIRYKDTMTSYFLSG